MMPIPSSKFQTHTKTSLQCQLPCFIGRDFNRSLPGGNKKCAVGNSNSNSNSNSMFRSWSPDTRFLGRYPLVNLCLQSTRLEGQQRQRIRDVDEITQAASRKGLGDAGIVSDLLDQFEALLPGLVNLHKLKASDWVDVISNIEAVAAKLVALKTVFPTADAYLIISRTPKALLKDTQVLLKDAQAVHTALMTVTTDPGAIVREVPELAVDPAVLSRVLMSISGAHPTADPMQILLDNPSIVYSLGGEGNVEPDAEYGDFGWTGQRLITDHQIRGWKL